MKRKDRSGEIVALFVSLVYAFMNIVSFYWGYIATPKTAWEYNMSFTGFCVFPVFMFLNIALFFVVMFSNGRKGVK